jgi:hypothetical protein
MDNYGTHETPLIRNWFAKQSRVHAHFTPTYGSWLNLVERWFAELTTNNSAARLKAFGADTGTMLWKTIVGGVVSVSTITYAVNGKQYIA